MSLVNKPKIGSATGINSQAASLLGQSGVTAAPPSFTPGAGGGITQPRLGVGYGSLSRPDNMGVGNISIRPRNNGSPVTSARPPSNINPDGTHPYPVLTGEIYSSLGIDPIIGQQLTALSEQKLKLTNAKLPQAQKDMLMSFIDAKISKLQSSSDSAGSPADNEWVKKVEEIAARKQAALTAIADKYAPQMESIINSSQVSDRYKSQYRALVPIIQERLSAQAAASAQEDLLKYYMSLNGYLPGTQPIYQTPTNATSSLFTT